MVSIAVSKTVDMGSTPVAPARLIPFRDFLFMFSDIMIIRSSDEDEIHDSEVAVGEPNLGGGGRDFVRHDCRDVRGGRDHDAGEFYEKSERVRFIGLRESRGEDD